MLFRSAGEKLNTALVKAFVNVVTFFPLGSLVRTNREELGVVIRTNPNDPLHPVISLVSEGLEPQRELDTSVRNGAGEYERHVLESLKPQTNGLDLARYFPELSSASLAGGGPLGAASV